MYEAADNPQDPEMQYFQQKMSCILQIFWYNPVSAHPCVASIATPYVREEVKEMSRYELIYIIDTAVEDSARKELIERVNNLIAANSGDFFSGETTRALNGPLASILAQRSKNVCHNC